ncbi:haloacid dehalogenase-like hydrolase [Bulleidia sp. zg-1006]|uniref:haloacid dehalogenase-like hydrolase n=1 Tax=Bulleidia sp. zg-1006 TaxID=2806552 RepID=UPI00193A504B|nr:haloacid dehalogenase-like hydrolase [Bulleidia sp. zg-1006]QRG86197.1 haloacid dehalogenase-like hydrolase [Bulleidia sp. zg-1006]
MNVYDWDKTIYDGDSTFGFIRYLFCHYPKTLLNLPRIIFFGIGYGLQLVSKQSFKENLFHLFVYVKDMPLATKRFCESHLDHVKSFYQQKEDDVIISASPEFLIQEFGRLLHIQCIIASPVEQKTGHYMGLNCHGEEKVKRFYKRFPKGEIHEFYSDSLSDTLLAQLAKKAFLVKKEKVFDWPK